MEYLSQNIALFNNASVGIVIVNRKGAIELINPFALRLFGYRSHELIGKSIEILIPQRFQKKHVRRRRLFHDGNAERPMGIGRDLFGVKKKGLEFPVEISLSKYQTNDEDFAIAFISDITIRKKTEAEIQQLNIELEETVKLRTGDLEKTLQELKAANQQLETAITNQEALLNKLRLSGNKLDDIISFQKALLDYAGAMIIATDMNGLIQLFNPEAASNLGYKNEEVAGKFTLTMFHDPKEIEKLRKELHREFGHSIKSDFEVLIERARRDIHEERQFTYVRKDGSSFPVSLTVTAVRDVNGKINGFMGIGVNISERQKAEQELRVALTREKELNELKTRFVSMASHEFRTPLSTVLSSAYLIEKYKQLDDQPKREKHLRRIIDSVSLLTDILDDFLSLGKIEEGKILVKYAKINLQEVVQTVLDEVKNTLKCGQAIRYQHTGDPVVNIDVSLLKHIVMNLLSNASKFSYENSAITVKTSCTKKTIKISVADKGIGISEADQQHLMERFFRGNNAANIKGTGLGLHIIMKYAELLHGKISFKSQLEKGSEFTVAFNT